MAAYMYIAPRYRVRQHEQVKEREAHPEAACIQKVTHWLDAFQQLVRCEKRDIALTAGDQDAYPNMFRVPPVQWLSQCAIMIHVQ
jgi:hypothetical protein